MERFMLSRDLIEYICSHHDDTGLINALKELLAGNGNTFRIDTAESIDNALETRIEQCPHPLSEWLSTLSDSGYMLPRFLYSRFLARQGKYAQAVDILQSVVETLPSAEPFLLLHLVRLLVRTKHFSKAAEYLKRALSLYPPYSFFIKCEKLVQKIIASGEWPPRRTIRVALLGNSTTSFLTSVLKAVCFKSGIYVDVYEGEYGNLRQDILNSASTLYKFNPQAAIILLNHREFALPPLTSQDIAQNIAEEIRQLWTTLQKQNPCHLIQVGFDQPEYGSWGSLEDTLTGGRARIVNSINSLLSENLPSGVSFFDINRVASCLGENFRSEIDWYSSKQYPSLEALPLLADHLVAHLRAAFGYSAKMLVLDLDNTLWGGVIGEDGLGGILLGPPSPEGEGYLDLQRYVKELKDRGVLIAVCSKNNLEDAELPFKEHDSTILRLNDFVIFTANWQDKASNIQEMAERLSLGLDSFVFLDDNPLERSWVRSRIPEVITPECGNKPWDMLATLRRGMYFESITLTAEDKARHNSYQSNLVRQELEKSSRTVEEFLFKLEMISECGPIDSTTFPRVTQLINKTNQFNLTTRRYTEEQVRHISESLEWWTRWFRLKDKFGDHGLIGVILAKKNGKIWNIDTWLMSCRVLGRKMEEFMFAQLVKSAQEDGVLEILGEYIPSTKNSLVKDVYPNLGFLQGDEPNQFAFPVINKIATTCEFIHSAKPSW